jgi:hypothetical protein
VQATGPLGQAAAPVRAPPSAPAAMAAGVAAGAPKSGEGGRAKAVYKQNKAKVAGDQRLRRPLAARRGHVSWRLAVAAALSRRPRAARSTMRVRDKIGVGWLAERQVSEDASERQGSTPACMPGRAGCIQGKGSEEGSLASCRSCAAGVCTAPRWWMLRDEHPWRVKAVTPRCTTPRTTPCIPKGHRSP